MLPSCIFCNVNNNAMVGCAGDGVKGRGSKLVFYVHSCEFLQKNLLNHMDLELLLIHLVGIIVMVL
jgi:hypothetical protein